MSEKKCCINCNNSIEYPNFRCVECINRDILRGVEYSNFKPRSIEYEKVVDY